MKILFINNYFYLFGGAEKVFFNTKELLEDHGHEVVDFAMADKKNLPSSYSEYFIDNVDLTDRSSAIKNFSRFSKTTYNKQAQERLSELIKAEKPDIAFVHNIGRRISNSIFDTLFELKVPTVHMLHDYKPICSINTFFREGQVCEQCLGHAFYRVCLNRCNSHSLSASMVDSLEKYSSWRRHLYDKVDLFISPSAFLKKKMVEGGLDSKKIVVLPHFIETKNIKPKFDVGDYIFCFSRLDRGKGIETLIDVVGEMEDVSLKIAGDGPLREDLEKRASNYKNIEFLGKLEQKVLNQAISDCFFVVVPSEWYEVFGMVSIEAMSQGKAVLASNMGGIPEVISDKETGLIFEAANKKDLRDKIIYMFANKNKVVEMGRKSAEKVKRESSPEDYYNDLIGLFERVINKDSIK